MSNLFPEIFTDETDLEYKNSQPKLELFNVEDCFRLTTGHFGRHILRRAEKPTPDAEKTFTISDGLSRARIFYRFFKDGATVGLRIRCCANGHWLSQNIEFDYSYVKYGRKPFMMCGCGYRASTLYLRPDNYHMGFACKKCAKLLYQIRRINKTSKTGRLLYSFGRVQKLMEMEGRLRRPVYKHTGTMRLLRFVIARQKWVPVSTHTFSSVLTATPGRR